MDPRLQNNPALMSFVAPSSLGPTRLQEIGAAVEKLGNEVTNQNALAMVKAVQLKIRPTEQTDVIAPDGHTEFRAYESQVRSGRFNLEPHIAATLPDYSAQYKDMDRLSEARSQDFAIVFRADRLCHVPNLPCSQAPPGRGSLTHDVPIWGHHG